MIRVLSGEILNEFLWPESNKRRLRITIAAFMREIQSDLTRPKAHNRNGISVNNTEMLSGKTIE